MRRIVEELGPGDETAHRIHTRYRIHDWLANELYDTDYTVGQVKYRSLVLRHFPKTRRKIRRVDRYFLGSFTYVKLAEGEVVPEYEVEFPPEAEDDEGIDATTTSQGKSSSGMKVGEDNDSKPAETSARARAEEGSASGDDDRAPLPQD